MAKRSRDAEKTRRDILAAAEAQFALKGYYGARVDEIAHEARINKRMIYEYYTNKETLYERVLHAVYRRMEEAEIPLMEAGLTGVALIRAIITMYFDFLGDNPAFVSILMWENLNQARFLRTLSPGDIRRATTGYFVDEIRRGRREGVFRADIDAEQAVMSLITICFSNFSNRHTLSVLFDCDLDSREMMEKRKAHTLDIMLAYLCP